MQLMELPELNLIAGVKKPQLKGSFFYNANYSLLSGDFT